MNFSVDYKQRVYNVLQNNTYLRYCMEALEANNTNGFRIYLDMALDEVKKGLAYRPILDDSDRILWNGLVKYYNEIKALYNEFMICYNQELDEEEVKNKKHAVR